MARVSLKDWCLINAPSLLSEWDIDANAGKTADDYSHASNDKVYWKCSKCGHRWQARIGNRTLLNRGCPVCGKKRAKDKMLCTKARGNNLAEKHPELEKEWIIEKNGGKTADQFACGSDQYAWWKCSRCGFEWYAQIKKRALRHYGCPQCAKDSTSFPEQAIFYYVSKVFPEAVSRETGLGFELDVLLPEKRVAIEYDGIRWHKGAKSLEKDNRKDKKCREYGLMLYRIRDIQLPHTESATIIDCVDGDDISLQKAIEQLFLCLGTSLNTSIDIKRDTQEILSGYKKQLYNNSLAVKFPDLAKEWHPTLNGGLSPESVEWGSGRPVWWKCSKCGYEWRATPNHRTRNAGVDGSGCYKCARERINRTNNVKIINLDTGQVFDSLTEAAESCGGRKSDICTCCNGKQKTAFGFHWAYLSNGERRKKNITGRVRNDTTGEVFANSIEAAKSCDGDSRNINRCCRGETKTAYGFSWTAIDMDLN